MSCGLTIVQVVSREEEHGDRGMSALFEYLTPPGESLHVLVLSKACVHYPEVLFEVVWQRKANSLR